MYAKEEELVEVQAKLGERDAALRAYKTENGRFADMKDKFKADIASLQQQVLTDVTSHCACSATGISNRERQLLHATVMIMPVHSLKVTCASHIVWMPARVGC